MSRLEKIQETIKELKIYKDYLLNIKVVNSLKNEKSNKVLVKK